MNKLRIGTSGWSYSHWQGQFYPEEVKKGEWLEFYAENFETVELNSSFYHLPRKSTFAGWRERTPEDFLFAVKVSRFISHRKHLKDCRKAWVKFYRRAVLLKEKLGPFLIQLSPNWKRDRERLEKFVEVIKDVSPGERFCFEFRHPSWFEEEIYHLLEENNLSLVVADTPDYPYRERMTADFLYLRLHGRDELYASEYGRKELEDWAEKMEKWGRSRDVYCYFDNDGRGFAPRNAEELKGILS